MKAKAESPERFTLEFRYPVADETPEAGQITVPIPLYDLVWTLPKKQRLVLWYLLERTYGNQQPSAIFSFEEIARGAQIPPKDVPDVLAKLERLGVFEIERQSWHPRSSFPTTT